jgi:imidazolonepropionase-like amidohydrolase
VCDGITACREAVRDEVRKGASHIKIMASGGVASPTDRLENLQFSEEELNGHRGRGEEREDLLLCTRVHR